MTAMCLIPFPEKSLEVSSVLHYRKNRKGFETGMKGMKGIKIRREEPRWIELGKTVLGHKTKNLATDPPWW
jgi:hypothetical protein